MDENGRRKTLRRDEPNREEGLLMAGIEEILRYERAREQDNLVLFLEGKFWKAYERSAYVLTRLYGFKPTKRFIKKIGEDVISVGFPQEVLDKYLSNAQVDETGKVLRAKVKAPQSEQGFEEWKKSTRVKESKSEFERMTKLVLEPDPKAVRQRVYESERVRDIGLPVFRVVYDLLLRLFQESRKWSKDYRYTLGEDIKKNLLRAEVCIYHANDTKAEEQKADYIIEALERVVEVKLCVRILHDCGEVSLQKYAVLAEQMVEAEKQLQNWRKRMVSDSRELKNN